MKKHIQKRFLHETELKPEDAKTLEESGLGMPTSTTFKTGDIPKGAATFLSTEDNKFFKAFQFTYQNKVKLIPEPDPILVYFHAAYLNYCQIDKQKKEIFEKLAQDKMNEVMIRELYDYFSLTSSYVMLLFTAIEAMMNRSIKREYVYRKETARKTELFSKKQIERYIPFDEKLKAVLPEATGKDFSKQFPLKYKHIDNLKVFRDMIVHTKEAEDESTYDYLFKKAFSFDFDGTIDAAKDFCNYYTKPDFIIECSCSIEW